MDDLSNSILNNSDAINALEYWPNINSSVVTDQHQIPDLKSNNASLHSYQRGVCLSVGCRETALKIKCQTCPGKMYYCTTHKYHKSHTISAKKQT